MIEVTDTVSQPVDTKARTRALDIRESFAVSAPAGSGKTGLLTQRLLKLLGSCEQPEEVLAITFTRKAAGEMRERLIEALRNARETAEPENPHELTTWILARQLLQRDEEKNWQLLQSPQRLRIQTIDGLCRSLASQLPIESGMGAPGEPLEQPQIAFEMAIVNLLKQLDTEEPDGALQSLLLHLDNDLGQLNKLLQILLGKREQWLGPLLNVNLEGAEDYFHFVIDELITENLGALQEVLRGYAGELVELTNFAGTNLRRDKPDHPLCQCADLGTLPPVTNQALPQWLALVGLLVTNTGELRKPGGINKNLGFPALGKKDPEKPRADEYKTRLKELLAELAGNRQLLDAIAEVRALPAGMVRDQWQLLQALAQVLPLLVAELKLVFQQLGATDYTEVAQAALTALGEAESPTDLALKLDVQIRHILVDEFQDTSQLQLQLLEKLTAGWQAGDGRTLFIVGDGMQSCYGFRNANVGIFLDARSRGIGEVPLGPLDLQVNFRSGSPVVDWVNHTFQTAFPLQDNIGRGAVRYLPSQAFKNKNWNGAAVNFYGCVNDEERQQEAQQTARLVEELQQRDPEGRIAILVRKKKHLERILPELSAAGIAYQASELAPLASQMVVLDLLSLTRALHDPGDRISWLSVLRAPWCGLDLTDLYQVANWGNGEIPPLDVRARPLLQTLEEIDRIESLSEAARARLRRTGTLLRNAWQERRRKPLRAWIEGLWLALGGPAATADKSQLANIQDFFLLLEKFDCGGSIQDWKAFEQALQKLFARPAQEARVQVMTIHKSKGLEFEHVLIPGLDQGGKPGGDQLLRWAEWLNSAGENRFLLAPKSPRGDRDPLFDYLRHDNSERERLEGTRLLYVGCTRAIRSLHLLACVQLDEKSQSLKAPGGASLLASIWPAIGEETDWCHWLEADGATLESDTANDQSCLLRLPADWQAPALPRQELLAEYRTADYRRADTGEPNLPDMGQVRLRWLRHAGTVAHETLASIAQGRATIAQGSLDQWDSERLAQQQPLWQLRLQQLGLGGSGLERAQEKVEQAVRNTLACPSGRWLLDSGHRDSACELELHSGGRQLRRAIVDRTFIDEQGRRWIVDYKTAEPAADQPEEDFVEEQLERYRGQLEAYRKLFYARGERDIRCALYFPLLQKLAEL
ncbi:UvrD-helicase domain-containing protein [Microbulbifer sp.]|uniref:UvrD-helicase domain-containing protein n=1 Tax=Microbulbifer sp. TaxID=1908541 RepID=UPI003F350459